MKHVKMISKKPVKAEDVAGITFKDLWQRPLLLLVNPWVQEQWDAKMQG